MTNQSELPTIEIADLTTVTGGADKWENVMGDAGNAAGAYIGNRLGGNRGAGVGAVVGGAAGRAVGRAVDNYSSPAPLTAGAGFSNGRGPGSLNRGPSPF